MTSFNELIFSDFLRQLEVYAATGETKTHLGLSELAGAGDAGLWYILNLGCEYKYNVQLFFPGEVTVCN